MTIIFIAFIALQLYYTRIVFRRVRKKKVLGKISQRTFRLIKLGHYILLAGVLFLIIIQAEYEMSFRQEWIGKAIIICFLLSGALLYPLSERGVLKKGERIYLGSFSIIAAASPFILLIPFLGMAIFFSTLGKMFLSPKIFYEDSAITIQSQYRGIMAPMALEVLSNRGVFRQSLASEGGLGLDGFDSIGVRHDPDSTRIVLLPKNAYRHIVSITVGKTK